MCGKRENPKVVWQIACKWEKKGSIARSFIRETGLERWDGKMMKTLMLIKSGIRVQIIILMDANVLQII